MKLVDYEIDVLKIMLVSDFSESEIEDIIYKSVITKIDHTGVGYFLSLSNKLFPIERVVISKPALIGKLNEIEVGFVIFLESKSLTLECHSWGDMYIPKNLRKSALKISEFRNP